MVWFQCEDCGEHLKKPKLPGHFRMCSAHKLSCIDCGYMFTQQSVQGHTQCMTEAEKYGPKGQAKPVNGTPAKPKAGPKPTADVDISVGLSTCPPWNCSLCNTNTTSEQTLLLHAEGRKHRAKARAFHASKNPPSSKPVYSALNQTGTMKDHLNGGMVNKKDATKVNSMRIGELCPRCLGHRMTFYVSRNDENLGRPFLKCQNRYGEAGCGYFRWLNKQPKHPTTTRVHPRVPSNIPNQQRNRTSVVEEYIRDNIRTTMLFIFLIICLMLVIFRG